jgi:hypothetical protein
MVNISVKCVLSTLSQNFDPAILLRLSAKIKNKTFLPRLAVSPFNESRTIAGNKLAWQIEYEFKGIGGTVRRGLNSLTINDNIGYSLVFSTDKKSFDRYFPTTQKMIDSFHIPNWMFVSGHSRDV